MHLAGGKTPGCSSCAYWQSYPAWEGVGTCESTLSRSYGRMAFGAAAPCEYYVDINKPRGLDRGFSTNPGRRVTSRPGSICEECQYWLPFELMPRIGQCDNPSSRHFGGPAFSDKPTEECFVERSLEGLDFMWCETHRMTIFSAELPNHRGCRVFASSAILPVEEEMELTLAGD